MDQQQVDVLRLQLAQALVDALVGFLLACVRDPHLRHEEQVFALDSTLAPSRAHTLLVLVSLRRIDEPVAHVQRIRHASFTLVRTYLKHAVAQQRHLHSV